MPCRHCRRLRQATSAAVLLFLAGGSCIDPDGRGRDRAEPQAIKGKRSVIGRSVKGRPIEMIAFGAGPDVVLIMATIHGNEDVGTPLLKRLVSHLEANPNLSDGRRVLLLPDVNPDGRAEQLRGNTRGVDLNRNFPADNYQNGGHHGAKPLSEPESAAIHSLLMQERPSRIVSIHQPLNYGSECIDYDGPGQSLAAEMGRHTNIPVRRIGSRPGSLGSFAGETLGIPIITLELPKEAKGRAVEELWRDYGPMLLAAIDYSPGQGHVSH